MLILYISLLLDVVRSRPNTMHCMRDHWLHQCCIFSQGVLTWTSITFWCNFVWCIFAHHHSSWRLFLIHVVFFRSSVEIHVHCVSDFLFRLQVQCVSDLLFLGYSFLFLVFFFRISVQCVSDLLSWFSLLCNLDARWQGVFFPKNETLRV